MSLFYFSIPNQRKEIKEIFGIDGICIMDCEPADNDTNTAVTNRKYCKIQLISDKGLINNLSSKVKRKISGGQDDIIKITISDNNSIELKKFSLSEIKNSTLIIHTPPPDKLFAIFDLNEIYEHQVKQEKQNEQTNKKSDTANKENTIEAPISDETNSCNVGSKNMKKKEEIKSTGLFPEKTEKEIDSDDANPRNKQGELDNEVISKRYKDLDDLQTSERLKDYNRHLISVNASSIQELEKKIKSLEGNFQEAISNSIKEHVADFKREFQGEIQKEISIIKKHIAETIIEFQLADHRHILNKYMERAMNAAEDRFEKSFRKNVIKRFNHFIEIAKKYALNEFDAGRKIIEEIIEDILKKIEISEEFFGKALETIKSKEAVIGKKYRDDGYSNFDQYLNACRELKDYINKVCWMWLEKYNKTAFKNKEECLLSIDKFAKEELLPFIEQELPQLLSDQDNRELDSICNQLLNAAGLSEISVKEYAPFTEDLFEKVDTREINAPSNSVVKVAISGYQSELSGRVIRKPAVVVSL